MKKMLLILAALAMVACSGDKVNVDTHGDRIDELERRMNLNEALDAHRSVLIATNSELIQMLISDFDQRINDLTSDLNALDQAVNDLIYIINNLPTGSTSVSTSGNILNIGGSCVTILLSTQGNGNSSVVNGVTLQPIVCP